tara:strand:- start:2311 stop:2583 length:273 start_codon:yes stop_codon:yes gene_type:complete
MSELYIEASDNECENNVIEVTENNNENNITNEIDNNKKITDMENIYSLEQCKYKLAIALDFIKNNNDLIEWTKWKEETRYSLHDNLKPST